jgi:hypothetical protein
MTDGSASPLAEFAAQLRELREASGSPSYRVMAQRSHYSSSALAEAAQGRKLPSRALVEAYATACGADPVDWVARWKKVAAQDPPGEAPAPPPDRRVLTGGSARLIAVALVSAALAAVVTGTAVRGSAPTPVAQTATTSPSPSATGLPRLPANGADPVEAGCAADAVLLAHQPVVDRGKELGTLELKYSPACQAGWARFSQDAGVDTALAAVSVSAQDGRTALFADVPIDTRSIYTDVLHAAGTCLVATVAVTARDGIRTTTQTGCVAGPA